MVEKEQIGYFTEASRVQKQYEDALVKTKKTEHDWDVIRNGSVNLWQEIKNGEQVIRKMNPDANKTLLFSMEFQEVVRTQIIICELGKYLSNIETRLIKLEKMLNNLSLKVK